MKRMKSSIPLYCLDTIRYDTIRYDMYRSLDTTFPLLSFIWADSVTDFKTIARHSFTPDLVGVYHVPYQTAVPQAFLPLHMRIARVTIRLTFVLENCFALLYFLTFLCSVHCHDRPMPYANLRVSQPLTYINFPCNPK